MRKNAKSKKSKSKIILLLILAILMGTLAILKLMDFDMQENFSIAGEEEEKSNYIYTGENLYEYLKISNVSVYGFDIDLKRTSTNVGISSASVYPQNSSSVSINSNWQYNRSPKLSKCKYFKI